MKHPKHLTLGRYCSALGRIVRSQLKSAIRHGLISIDGVIATSITQPLYAGQMLSMWEHSCIVRDQIVILLHKPSWYVSSDVDEGQHLSYRHLLLDCPYYQMVHVAGRLDRDTEGLLVCTNDWLLTHQLIKPTKDIGKTYTVHARSPLSDLDIKQLELWVLIDTDYLTKPAKVERLDGDKILLTITEGKFHQIKKMLTALSNEVVYLRRESVWPYQIGDIPLGKWKLVTF